MGVAEIPGISIDPTSVVTNIVIFDVSQSGMRSSEICARLKENGVLAIAISDTKVRMVTHLDVSGTDVVSAITTLANILS